METGEQPPNMPQWSAEGAEQMLWDGSTSVPVPSEAEGGVAATRGHPLGAQMMNLLASGSTPICDFRQIGYTK